MSSPLDDLDDTAQFDVEEWKAVKQDAYEERFIKYLMQEFNLAHQISKMKHDCYEVTGKHQLNWNWFANAFPSFPVRFMPRSIPYVHQIMLRDLFQRFTKTPIYVEFEKGIEIHGLDPHAQTVGMVFEWPQLGRVVMHNYASYHSPDIQLRRELLRPPITFVIERCQPLVDHIKEVWAYC